ncbi:MAG: type III pantothenate kinase [Phycisphaeraceae bacterium]|nr:type III pantothenate kinase [Phycisphaeraceae bacterium]
MTDRLVLASVGNSRIRVAAAVGGELQPSDVFEARDTGAATQAVIRMLGSDDDRNAGDNDAHRLIIATVNDRAATALAAGVKAGLNASGSQDRVLRFGADLPIPIQNSLDDDSTVGQDRLLDALGAFSRSKQACVVIDAGTAVTVDFVDGQGVFHGGAIAPGLAMMAASLHDRTSALPLIDFRSDVPGLIERLRSSPFGKDTRHAIELGIVSAVRGMAHHLIDRYAEHYGAYPRVIATGGDAALLFDGDELVELIVPDLPLIGMLAAVERLRTLEGEHIEPSDDE